ncbi:MAG: hypothetical protein HGA31_00115 [Candidatus Moranbacteria bacterium]|nr:hypothetical protein [Candidatus Moranbacteria bacterium]
MKSNKKIILFAFVAVFAMMFFVCDVHTASAWDPFGWIKDASSAVLSGASNAVGGVFLTAINVILYAVLGIVTLFLGVASVIFAWSTDATVWQQLFNMPATYTLWGMVRDFFNLFFILTLLFVAFGTIFQIQAYNYRKWLLQLVLMALLVNFSFPVSRFIVDATNVPMYFFINSMLGNSGGDATTIFETMIGGSDIKTLLLPTEGNMIWQGETTGNLVQAIIFMFLLSASLLMLAIMFVIRLVMLLILVIFSPVGFAATAIPGFQSLAKQWWDNFMKYAIFGPSAMFMILVSCTFLANFKNGAQSTRVDLVQSYSSGVTASENRAHAVTSMVVTIVPVILIWASMSIGQKMGIYGAGMAQKAGMGAMKRVTGLAAGEKRWGSFRNEWKKRSDERYNANNIGTRFGQRTTLAADKVQSKIGSDANKKMSATSAQIKEQALIKEEAKRRAINSNTSNTEIKKQLAEARNRKDGAHMAALLAEMKNRPELHGEMQHGDVQMVDKRFKDRGGMNNAVVQETKEKVGEVNLAAAHGTDIGEMKKVLTSGKVKMENQTANALTGEVLQAGLETNKINQTIADELAKDGDKAAMLSTHLNTALTAYERNFDTRLNDDKIPGANLDEKRNSVQGKALLRQRTAAHQTYLSQNGDFHDTMKVQAADSAAEIARKEDQQNKVFEKSDAVTYKRMSGDNIRKYMPRIAEHLPSGKVATIAAGLADEDKQKPVDFIKAYEKEARMDITRPLDVDDPADKKIMDARITMNRLKSDNRTRGLVKYGMYNVNTAGNAGGTTPGVIVNRQGRPYTT